MAKQPKPKINARLMRLTCHALEGILANTLRCDEVVLNEGGKHATFRPTPESVAFAAVQFAKATLARLQNEETGTQPGISSPKIAPKEAAHAQAQ